ncbi:8756_t:CDS:2 [Diversispora eburnea]|uniref:8756_t:CDS:1 n=1 Tax=Diversispora eburnea TaxID=1213867 RepID=A0A9N8WG24_9GLOM|nr:8756_t:CDS:2 [Diversispora eburnea]
MYSKEEGSPSNGNSNDIKLDQHDIGGDSSTLRQRRPNPTPTAKPSLARRNYKNFTLMKRIVLAIFVFGLIYNKFGRNGNEIPFEHDDEGSSELNYEESELASFRMNKFRIAIRDLGITMAKSDIIVQNGESISRVLFNLDEDVRDTGDKFDDFIHISDKFFWTTTSEMDAILRTVKREMIGPFEFMSDDAGNFIRRRLEVLDGQIPPFQNILAAVIASIQKIEDSVSNTQGYLKDGEREAQQILEKHWKGSIADYSERKRAETELVQVRFTLQMLKDIAPNIINFESFLKDYRRKIQEIAKEIKVVPKKITAEDTKYLKKAVSDLEKQYAKFSSAMKNLDRKPLESYYIEDELNNKNRDCTEFQALLQIPNAYLKTIKVWYSEVVNAIAFVYTDGTSKIYGLPNDMDPYIFEWYKDEKIKQINKRVGSVLYAIQFETDRGRISNWVGGDKGNTYAVLSGGPATGIHGSFSRQICSIGIVVN